jgi:PAS domain S-box-containing protein
MKYRQLLECAPTCILVVRDGNILYANPAVSVFSGYYDKDLIGKDLLSFVSPSDHNEFTKLIQGCIKAKHGTGRSEFRFVTKTGDVKVALLFATFLIHESEPAILINLVDISENNDSKTDQD